MKKTRVLITAALCAFAFASMGCASTVIGAAASKYRVQTSDGKTVDVTLPKEIQADGFDFLLNPHTGEVHLKARSLTTSSQRLVDSAAIAQAQSIGKLTEALAVVLARLPAPNEAAASRPALTPSREIWIPAPIFEAPEPTLRLEDLPRRPALRLDNLPATPAKPNTFADGGSIDALPRIDIPAPNESPHSLHLGR